MHGANVVIWIAFFFFSLSVFMFHVSFQSTILMEGTLCLLSVLKVSVPLKKIKKMLVAGCSFYSLSVFVP